MPETMPAQDNRGVVWRGYTEPHAISNVGRKLDGTARLAATPEVELGTPADVADWISCRAAQISTTAHPHARRLNARKITPWSVHRSVAATGRSVYTSVHIAPGRVVDVCAEVVL